MVASSRDVDAAAAAVRGSFVIYSRERNLLSDTNTPRNISDALIMLNVELLEFGDLAIPNVHKFGYSVIHHGAD